MRANSRPSLWLGGTRALVTAGASGIGLAAATRLVELGASVLVTDVDRDALASAESRGITTMVADASKEQDVVETAHALTTRLGGLDILVNNAGIAGPTASIEKTDSEAWRTTMRVNVDSQFLHVKHLAGLLRDSPAPAIVNVSSAAGLRAFRDRSAYASSKWAVIGLTKTAAAELGPDGIRVNAVCPGVIDGPRLERVIDAKATTAGVSIDEARKMFVAQTALGRASTAEDVADAITFLVSSMARTISGQVLSVDGFIEKMA